MLSSCLGATPQLAANWADPKLLKPSPLVFLSSSGYFMSLSLLWKPTKSLILDFKKLQQQQSRFLDRENLRETRGATFDEMLSFSKTIHMPIL